MAGSTEQTVETSVTDPRIVRTRARVLDAASALLLEGGPRAVTVDAVVARSGVAKTTIYRHWPSHEELVVALYVHVAPTIDLPDPSLTPRQALVAVCRSMAAALEDERWQRLLPALLLTRLEYGMISELKERIEHQHISVVSGVLQRLIDAGEIEVSSIEEHVHLLIGPLLTRSLMYDDSRMAEFADLTAAHYLRGAAPSNASGRATSPGSPSP